MTQNEKVQEFINHIREYFFDENDPIDEEDFLEIFERYVDYVCGKETNNDVLIRLSNRLHKQLEEDSSEKVEKKTIEFYQILESENNKISEFNKDPESEFYRFLENNNNEVKDTLNRMSGTLKDLQSLLDEDE
jgi:hypothetical protein